MIYPHICTKISGSAQRKLEQPGGGGRPRDIPSQHYFNHLLGRMYFAQSANFLRP